MGSERREAARCVVEEVCWARRVRRVEGEVEREAEREARVGVGRGGVVGRELWADATVGGGGEMTSFGGVDFRRGACLGFARSVSCFTSPSDLSWVFFFFFWREMMGPTSGSGMAGAGVGSSLTSTALPLAFFSFFSFFWLLLRLWSVVISVRGEPAREISREGSETVGVDGRLRETEDTDGWREMWRSGLDTPLDRSVAADAGAVSLLGVEVVVRRNVRGRLVELHSGVLMVDADGVAGVDPIAVEADSAWIESERFFVFVGLLSPTV